jgi:hypothetical protein
METLTQNLISYKGFVIAPETEPWAIKFNQNFFFYAEGEQGASDCSRHGFATVEDAKLGIDECICDTIDSLQRREKYLRSLMTPALWSKEIMKEWEEKIENVQKEISALCKVQGYAI